MRVDTSFTLSERIIVDIEVTGVCVVDRNLLYPCWKTFRVGREAVLLVEGKFPEDLC